MKKNPLLRRLLTLGVTMLLYLALTLISKEKVLMAVGYSLEVFKEILPILLIVYVFMVAFNFIPEKRLKASIQKSEGFFQYLILSVLGMVSHGPIYAWYPLLSDLRKKGLTEGAIAAYLFSKGIKLTLIPIMALYFGLTFTLVFSLTLYL